MNTVINKLGTFFKHITGTVPRQHNSSQQNPQTSKDGSGKTEQTQRIKIPPELYRDFIRLGLTPGSPLQECKAAHKSLLIKHHPDKHADNPFTLNIAHEITAGINESYQKIAYWYKTGRIE